MSEKEIIYCADVIARYGDRYVLVKRHNTSGKLAMPGGKQDCVNGSPEPLSSVALRELFEETGLRGTIVSTLSTKASPTRDPRGTYVTTVFLVDAKGELQGEEGKTTPYALTQAEIEAQYQNFAFDHAAIYSEYFAQQ
jgi:ADP-ribose pyrophosphatase YjhB (NUDIX family)